MKKMKFKKRRFFALILAFVLCVGSVDVSAFAAGTDESVETVTDLGGEISPADENDQTAGDNEATEVIRTASEETKATEESKASEESEETEESKASEESEETEESKASEEPEETEESKASEEPKTTEETKASEESEETEESKASDESKATEESKASDESEETEESKASEEVPEEVKAFLDAVAKLPAPEEVTKKNAEEIGEQINAVIDMAEALDDDHYLSDEVQDALNNTVYVLMEVVLTAENIEAPMPYGDVSPEQSLFSRVYNIYVTDYQNDTFVEELEYGEISLNIDVAVGEKKTDSGILQAWCYGDVYEVTSWDDVDVWSTNENVLKVSHTINGKILTITYEGVADGTASVKIAFNATTTSTGQSGVWGPGNSGAASVSGIKYGTVTVGTGVNKEPEFEKESNFYVPAGYSGLVDCTVEDEKGYYDWYGNWVPTDIYRCTLSDITYWSDDTSIANVENYTLVKDNYFSASEPDSYLAVIIAGYEANSDTAVYVKYKWTSYDGEYTGWITEKYNVHVYEPKAAILLKKGEEHTVTYGEQSWTGVPARGNVFVKPQATNGTGNTDVLTVPSNFLDGASSKYRVKAGTTAGTVQVMTEYKKVTQINNYEIYDYVVDAREFIVDPQPTAKIKKTVDDDKPVAGDEIKYTVAITNTDKTTALTNLVVTDVLNDNLTVEDIANPLDAKMGTAKISGNTITWNIPRLNAGKTALLHITVKVKDTVAAGTVIPNSVSVKSGGEDVDSSDDSDPDVDITVAPTYTVTYTDGVESEEIFADQTTEKLKAGVDTPAFQGTPTRTGYTFKGWKLNDTDTVLTNDQVKAKKILAADAVNGVITYTATWEQLNNLVIYKKFEGVDTIPKDFAIEYTVNGQKVTLTKDTDGVKVDNQKLTIEWSVNVPVGQTIVLTETGTDVADMALTTTANVFPNTMGTVSVSDQTITYVPVPVSDDSDEDTNDDPYSATTKDPVATVVNITNTYTKPEPKIAVTKKMTTLEDDIVKFDVTVENTGNISLYNLMLVDTMDKTLKAVGDMNNVQVTVTDNDGNTEVSFMGTWEDAKAPVRNNGRIVWTKQGGVERDPNGENKWDFTWILGDEFKVGAKVSLTYNAKIIFPEKADSVEYYNYADAIAGTEENDMPVYDGPNGISMYSFVSGGSGSVGGGSGPVGGTSKKYTLTYDFTGGMQNNEGSYTVEKWSNTGSYTFKVDETVQPTRKGYTFTKQWTDAEKTTTLNANGPVVATAANQHVTIYAVWKAEPAKIEFKENGGSEVADKTGTTGADITDTTMPTTIREGYIFGGWYDNEELTGEEVKALPDKFPAGTTTYYAKWTLNSNISYTVKYLEKGTSKQLHVPKTVTGKTFGETVTETAETISGYTPDEASKSLTLNKTTGNEIVFYYTKTPHVLGFGKFALYEGIGETEAAKAAIKNFNSLGVTIPTRTNNDGFAVVTLSDFTNGEIKLLYDLHVAGDPGAYYSVSDEDTEWVGGDDMEGELPDEVDNRGKAHAHIYVTKTFKRADVKNGWLHNAATVEDYYIPSTGVTEKNHVEEDSVLVEYTVTVNYVTDDKTPVNLGSISYTLNDKAPYNHEVGSSDAVPATGGADVKSPAKITNESGQTYVYDEIGTTDNLTGTIDGDDVTINVVYSLDEKGNIGTDDEGNLTDEPDGIPDKYQVKVTFEVKNGAWNNDSTADVVKYLTKYKTVEGVQVMAADGEATLGDIIPEVGEKPDEGFIAGNWDTEPTETTTITSDTTYTYTYTNKPAPGKVTITIKFVDENGNVVETETVVVDEGDTYDVREEVGKIPEGYEPNSDPDGDPVTGTADTDKTITVPVKQIIRYTVTYTDGVDGEEVFADQVTSNLVNGAATPAFVGTPVREGYTFAGWTPEVAATVTGNVTYTAQWEAIPYTVTYTDGVDDEEVFADQTTDNLAYGAATPAFVGTPVREGYTFAGWTPEVAATVTDNVIYIAQWTPNEPTPEDPTPDEPTPEEPTPDDPTPTPDDPTPTPDDPTPTPDDPTPTPDDPTPTPDDPTPTPDDPTQDAVPVPVVIPPAAPVPAAAPVPQVIPVAPTQQEAPAVPEEEAEPVTVIDDETLPLAEPEVTAEPEEEEPVMVEIDDEELPLAAGNGRAWALVNFALMNLAVFETLMLLIGYFVNTKKDEEEKEKEEKLKKKGLMRLISLPVGIISIVAFCLTEDISLPTGFVDRWTLLMAIIAIVQTVVVALSRKKEEKEDEKMA